MISPRVNLLLTLGAAALMAVPILAHHSGAMFEKEKTVTFEGVVKEFQYTNPHSWLLVDVKNKDGSVTTWGFEGEGPSTLQRSGIRPSDFKPGTKLRASTFVGMSPFAISCNSKS